MNIRRYEDNDHTQVIELWNSVFPNPKLHNKPETSLNNKLRHDDGLLFCAVEEETIVGTVMGGYDGHRGWLYSVAVHPAFRRQGIATQLIQEMETELGRRGCLKINLQVRATNSEVMGLYEKCGFVIEDIVSMGKRL